MVEEIAARTETVTLTFDRVVLTDSGTLIILWTNPCSNVWRLRQAYQQAFPGAFHLGCRRARKKSSSGKHGRAPAGGQRQPWHRRS